jgi:cobalt-zinc-cadmium resistance protein CzcA
MLTALIDLCLRHRPVVLLATAALALLGLSSLRRLPFDAFPDTTPVQVQVNTADPTLSPLEVERRITFPIEQALFGLPGLVEVRSLSKFGLSQVTVLFEDDVDLLLARQVVSERLASAELPESAARPSLGPLSTGLGEVFQYVLHGELSARELRTLHHWVVRPQMLRVPGVAEINTWGGHEKQLHVVVDPVALVKHALTLDDVAAVVRDGNRNAGGGLVDVAGEAQLVHGRGLVRGVDDLRAMVVAHVDGTPIRLEDVAEIREGDAIRRGAVTYGGRGEAVLGLGFMLVGENSRALTQRLEARLHEVRRGLPDGVEITEVYSRTKLVDEVLATVRDNLLEGALLVIAVLFVFLGSLRAGLIVALAIPLSMLFAFDAMLRFGIAGSLMSLGAIDFGLVVDSSVILVENASRRVEEDRSGRSVLEIVRDAAVEVRRPTLFGELVIAVVYLPILALEGVEGKLFRPMALTVIFALAGSMVLSLTLMPVLASYALRRGARPNERDDAPRLGRGVRALERGYARVLEWALGHRRFVLALGVVAVLSAGALAARAGSEFVPRLGEGAIVINTVRMAGIALDESVRYGTRIEQRLLERFPDEVAHVWTRTGTAEVATDPMGLEVSDVFVTLHPRDAWTRTRTQAELTAAMAETLEGLPGMRSVFTQPIEMRMNEMTAGIRADVGIKLFGDDFDVLAEKAEEVRRRVERIPGAADVTVEQLTGQAVLAIDVDREAAGRYGIPVGEILEVVDALGARRLGEVVEGQRRFDLVLRVRGELPATAERLREMLLFTSDGAQVPLGSVARVSIEDGPSTIQREWAKRRVVVQANVRGRDLGSFVQDVRAAVAEIELSEGYFPELGGQFEHLERARDRLLFVVPLALLLVFGLLYLTYGRASDALRVFVGVPFGAVGGMTALWLRDLPLSVSAAVGFVALSGVAVLGDMVLVSYVKARLAEGRELLEAVRESAVSRLRPVLMTSLVAALGFVPMAFNTGVGAEVQRPLATVVVGGMITSTLATLIVLPVLYVTFRRERTARS